MPFIPLGIAALLTLAITYETGKNAKRKFDKKRAKAARNSVGS